MSAYYHTKYRLSISMFYIRLTKYTLFTNVYYMNKSELFEKLNTLDIDNDKYFVLSGASLVAQDIIDETPDIDLSCSKDIYDSLDWDTRVGAFGTEIKFKDCFDIAPNFYEMKNETVTINGYNFANIKTILAIKQMLNRPKDKEIIKKLEFLI